MTGSSAASKSPRDGAAGPRRRVPAAPIRARGAAALIVGCFLASAAIRLLDPAGPAAQAAASMAQAEPGRGGGGAQECEIEGDAGALLQAVRERELQLRERELRVADRERLLEAAEARLRAERERLEEARFRLEETLNFADDAAEADIQRLVAVYESMDPKKSAKIFQTMDIGFAAGFLARMRQDVAAQVMAGLPAERAYAISATIAGRNARAPRE